MPILHISKYWAAKACKADENIAQATVSIYQLVGLPVVLPIYMAIWQCNQIHRWSDERTHPVVSCTAIFLFLQPPTEPWAKGVLKQKMTQLTFCLKQYKDDWLEYIPVRSYLSLKWRLWRFERNLVIHFHNFTKCLKKIWISTRIWCLYSAKTIDSWVKGKEPPPGST